MSSARNFGLTVVRSSGDEENVICPFHEDSSPSASFNRSKGLFFCYVCGVGYNTQQLADKLGIELDDELAGEILEDFDLLAHDAPLDLGWKIVGDHPYLAKRGINRYTTHKYDIRWKEGLHPAAILPVPNLKGEIEGAAYRFTDLKYSRYLKIGKMTPVWPMTFLKEFREGRAMVITEGAFSAMRMHTFFSDSVSSLPAMSLLGAKANRSILDCLAPFRPVFLYDHDKAGITACKKMRELSPLVKAFTLTTAPDDMNEGQLLDLMKKLEGLFA